VTVHLGVTRELKEALYSDVTKESLSSGETFEVKKYALPQEGETVYIQLLLPKKPGTQTYTIDYGDLTPVAVISGGDRISSDPSSITVSSEPVRVVFSITGTAEQTTETYALSVTDATAATYSYSPMLRAVGQYNEGSGIVPFVWDDQTITTLSVSGIDDLQDVTVTGCFIGPQNTVYACGYYSDGSITRVLYWADGVPTVVSAAGVEAIARDIYVYSSHVYIVGEVIDQTVTPATYMPTLWKDGVAVDLLDDTVGSECVVRDVLYDGGTIVAVGNYNNGVNTYVGTVWTVDSENTVAETTLSEGDFVEVHAVAIDGSNYIVVGAFWNGSSFASAYWTVNRETLASERTTLTSVEQASRWSKAHAVDVSGGVVRIVGYYTDGGEQPAIWVDGERSALGSGGRAFGVAQFGTVTYSTGYNSAGTEAYVWRGLVRSTLVGPTVSAAINAIDVVNDGDTYFLETEEEASVTVEMDYEYEDADPDEFQPYWTRSFKKTYVCTKCGHYFKEGEGGLIGGKPFCKRFKCFMEEMFDRLRGRRK